MGSFAVLRALFRYASAFPWFAAALGLTVVFDAFFETAIPLIVAWIIDHVVVPGRPELFLLPASLLVGGWMASALVQLARDWVLAQLAASMGVRLRETLVEGVSRTPYERLRALKAAEWQQLHGPDLQQVEALILNVVPLVLFGVAYLVLGVAAMISTQPGLGLLVLLGLPLTLIGPWILERSNRLWGRAHRVAEERAAAAANEFLAAQSVLRTFGAESFRRGLRAPWGSLLRWTGRFGFRVGLTRRLPNLAIHLVQLVLILVGAWLTLQGQLALGAFLAFNLLFANVLTAVLDLASTLGPLTRAAPAVEALERRLKVTATEGRRVPSNSADPLVFDDVWFAYGERPVLQGLSFTLKAASRTAIVGASGSGKSTLAALIAGLYHPDRGTVSLQGGGSLALVFQDNPTFDASLRFNVTLGEEHPDDEVWSALEAAQLAAWVRDLPQGLDTRAGAGGSLLSGGQRQRLALARALLRQPSLLVLDEATSALDPLTEEGVNATLRRLPGTVVHISHRLQGIVDYDRIVVLDQGRVAEAGTHDELLAQKGLYAVLWNRQAGLEVSGDRATITAAGLRSIPLFAQSPEPILERLAAAFVSESVEAGTRVIRQGQPGSRFFVVARGRVEVSLDDASGELPIAQLTDGDFFGEMSLLGAVPTSAHVRTTQPTILLALEKTTFLAVVSQDPALAASLAEVVRRRRDENADRPANLAQTRRNQ